MGNKNSAKKKETPELKNRPKDGDYVSWNAASGGSSHGSLPEPEIPRGKSKPSKKKKLHNKSNKKNKTGASPAGSADKVAAKKSKKLQPSRSVTKPGAGALPPTHENKRYKMKFTERENGRGSSVERMGQDKELVLNIGVDPNTIAKVPNVRTSPELSSRVPATPSELATAKQETDSLGPLRPNTDSPSGDKNRGKISRSKLTAKGEIVDTTTEQITYMEPVAGEGGHSKISRSKLTARGAGAANGHTEHIAGMEIEQARRNSEIDIEFPQSNVEAVVVMKENFHAVRGLQERNDCARCANSKCNITVPHTECGSCGCQCGQKCLCRSASPHSESRDSPLRKENVLMLSTSDSSGSSSESLSSSGVEGPPEVIRRDTLPDLGIKHDYGLDHPLSVKSFKGSDQSLNVKTDRGPNLLNVKHNYGAEHVFMTKVYNLDFKVKSVHGSDRTLNAKTDFGPNLLNVKHNYGADQGSKSPDDAQDADERRDSERKTQWESLGNQPNKVSLLWSSSSTSSSSGSDQQSSSPDGDRPAEGSHCKRKLCQRRCHCDSHHPPCEEIICNCNQLCPCNDTNGQCRHLVDVEQGRALDSFTDAVKAESMRSMCTNKQCRKNCDCMASCPSHLACTNDKCFCLDTCLCRTLKLSLSDTCTCCFSEQNHERCSAHNCKCTENCPCGGRSTHIANIQMERCFALKEKSCTKVKKPSKCCGKRCAKLCACYLDKSHSRCNAEKCNCDKNCNCEGSYNKKLERLKRLDDSGSVHTVKSTCATDICREKCQCAEMRVHPACYGGMCVCDRTCPCEGKGSRAEAWIADLTLHKDESKNSCSKGICKRLCRCTSDNLHDNCSLEQCNCSEFCHCFRRKRVPSTGSIGPVTDQCPPVAADIGGGVMGLPPGGMVHVPVTDELDAEQRDSKTCALQEQQHILPPVPEFPEAEDVYASCAETEGDKSMSSMLTDTTSCCATAATQSAGFLNPVKSKNPWIKKSSGLNTLQPHSSAPPNYGERLNLCKRISDRKRSDDSVEAPRVNHKIKGRPSAQKVIYLPEGDLKTVEEEDDNMLARKAHNAMVQETLDHQNLHVDPIPLDRSMSITTQITRLSPKSSNSNTDIGTHEPESPRSSTSYETHRISSHSCDSDDQYSCSSNSSSGHSHHWHSSEAADSDKTSSPVRANDLVNLTPGSPIIVVRRIATERITTLTFEPTPTTTKDADPSGSTQERLRGGQDPPSPFLKPTRQNDCQPGPSGIGTKPKDYLRCQWATNSDSGDVSEMFVLPTAPISDRRQTGCVRPPQSRWFGRVSSSRPDELYTPPPPPDIAEDGDALRQYWYKHSTNRKT